MELSPLHACKHDNGPWFINKAISISIISGTIAAIGINKEVELRAMLFNSSRYNPRVPPRQYSSTSVDILIKWTFLNIEKFVRFYLSLQRTTHTLYTKHHLLDINVYISNLGRKTNF